MFSQTPPDPVPAARAEYERERTHAWMDYCSGRPHPDWVAYRRAELVALERYAQILREAIALEVRYQEV